MGRLAKNVKLERTGFMRHAQVPAWDTVNGGQHGYAANQQTYISNEAHVSSPLVCIVIQAPLLFGYVTDKENLNGTFKAMMEEHSHSITGFDAELTVDFDVTPVGGAGQEQHEVINVTRAQPAPVHAMVDKRGRPFQRFLEWWIRYALMDPETKHPLASILNLPEGVDLGPDMISAVCLYFEPDPLFRYIDRAWLCVNMMPHTQGTSTSQRNKRDAQEVLNLEIPFTALSEVGAGVELLALNIMRQAKFFEADPFFKKAIFEKQEADILALDGVGYIETVREVSGNPVEERPRDWTETEYGIGAPILGLESTNGSN